MYGTLVDAGVSPSLRGSFSLDLGVGETDTLIPMEDIEQRSAIQSFFRNHKIKFQSLLALTAVVMVSAGAWNQISVSDQVAIFIPFPVPTSMSAQYSREKVPYTT